MTSEELINQNFTIHIESVENEIQYSIFTSIVDFSDEIQLKMHKVSLFINKSPKIKEFLDLLGLLMKFLNTSNCFPEVISKQLNEFTQQLESDLASRGEKLISTGIFTRFPSEKRKNLSKYFPDSLSDPLDEYLIKNNNTIMNFLFSLKEDLKNSIDSIIGELKAINDEVNKVTKLIDELSADLTLKLLTDSLNCWKEDILDLENYWKRKLYSCESKLSEKLERLNSELSRIIKIVIICLKE
ncbi:MAG: hypothetical protein ACFFAU_03255 [Candidatus Hodarchaeota archaeon]